MTTIRVGTAGWSYDDWKGQFYPKALKKSDYLSYYAKFFDFTEINSTFYAIPSQSTLLSWKEKTPDHFRFAVKMWQEITHRKGNGDLEQAVQRFFSSLSVLSSKIQTYLLQFPPRFVESISHQKFLTTLIHLLPERNHYVFELRHNSWFVPKVLDDLPLDERFSLATTYMPNLSSFYKSSQSFQYIRMIGDRSLTDFSHLQREQPEEWHDLIVNVQSLNNNPSLTDILVIFNNHFRGFSPRDVNDFKKALGLGLKEFKKFRSLDDFF
ncbi:DUF72 domain-containing protein [Candidatus Lokiarchaeum ossiferum]